MSIDLNSPEALFGKILEQLKSGNDRFDVIDHRFDALNLRFDGIDQKLVALQDCLQKTGRQVGSVELTTLTKDEHQ